MKNIDVYIHVVWVVSLPRVCDLYLLGQVHLPILHILFGSEPFWSWRPTQGKTQMFSYSTSSISFHLFYWSYPFDWCKLRSQSSLDFSFPDFFKMVKMSLRVFHPLVYPILRIFCLFIYLTHFKNWFVFWICRGF